MSRLLTGAAVIAMSLFLLAGVAASARSLAQSNAGSASIGITGWGNVTLSKGLGKHRTVRCIAASCPAERYPIHGRHIVLIETPYKGWKFTGWHDACTGTNRACVINLARLRTNARRKVNATFVPVGPGWTPAKPIPRGATANIGHGYQVRVNSVLPNVQLSPAAPAGKAYFAANVTVSYTGTRTSDQGNVGSIVWTAMDDNGEGSYGPSYSVTSAGDPPYPAPQPTLDDHHPLYPGHSTTGYVCWTVDSSEVARIDELGVSVSTPLPRATWFALR
jgi:hypothetical protein